MGPTTTRTTAGPPPTIATAIPNKIIQAGGIDPIHRPRLTAPTVWSARKQTALIAMEIRGNTQAGGIAPAPPPNMAGAPIMSAISSLTKRLGRPMKAGRRNV